MIVVLQLDFQSHVYDTIILTHTNLIKKRKPSRALQDEGELIRDTIIVLISVHLFVNSCTNIEMKYWEGGGYSSNVKIQKNAIILL